RRLRIAVAGWPALHDVGDEDLGALPADRAQQLAEQLTSWPHEGSAGGVLAGARALANEQEVGERVSLAWHGEYASPRQRTERADPYLIGNGCELPLRAHLREAS